MLTRIVLLLLTVGGSACAVSIDTSLRDATITAAVTTALLNDAAIDGTRLSISTEGGVVHLGGTQPTTDAVAAVLSIVRGVEGVRDVQSSIRVERDVGGGRFDQGADARLAPLLGAHAFT
jgi:osmotically-inducible protein OsmY